MLSHLVVSNQLFATPWTVAHQAPLSMGILQARILEWVSIPSSEAFYSCTICSENSYKHVKNELVLSCPYNTGQDFWTWTYSSHSSRKLSFPKYQKSLFATFHYIPVSVQRHSLTIVFKMSHFSPPIILYFFFLLLKSFVNWVYWSIIGLNYTNLKFDV